MGLQYDIISIIVNSRILEKFQILNMHLPLDKFELKGNILTRNGFRERS